MDRRKWSDTLPARRRVARRRGDRSPGPLLRREGAYRVLPAADRGCRALRQGGPCIRRRPFHPAGWPGSSTVSATRCPRPPLHGFRLVGPGREGGPARLWCPYTAILTYLVARDIFDRRTALVAGLVVALYTPRSSSWRARAPGRRAGLALFTIALIFTNLKVIPISTLAVGPGVGTLAAAAILVRATFLPYCLLALAVFMAVGAARTDRPNPWRTIIAAGGALAAILFCAGYEAQMQSGRFTVLPSSATLNLFIGNNADQCHTLALRPGLDWDLLERLPRTEGVVGIWNESDWFRHRAVDYAIHSPGSFLAGLVRKANALIVSRADSKKRRRLPASRRIVRAPGRPVEAGAVRLPFRAAHFRLRRWARSPSADGCPGRSVARMLGSYAAVVVSVSWSVDIRVAPRSTARHPGCSGCRRASPRLCVSAARVASSLCSEIMLPALVLTAVPWRYCAERLDLRSELRYASSLRLTSGEAIPMRRSGVPSGARSQSRLFRGTFRISGRLLAWKRNALRTRSSHSAKPRPSARTMSRCSSISPSVSHEADSSTRHAEVLDRASEHDPNNPIIHNSLGMIFAMRLISPGRRSSSEEQWNSIQALRLSG